MFDDFRNERIVFLFRVLFIEDTIKFRVFQPCATEAILDTVSTIHTIEYILYVVENANREVYVMGIVSYLLRKVYSTNISTERIVMHREIDSWHLQFLTVSHVLRAIYMLRLAYISTIDDIFPVRHIFRSCIRKRRFDIFSLIEILESLLSLRKRSFKNFIELLFVFFLCMFDIEDVKPFIFKAETSVTITTRST